MTASPQTRNYLYGKGELFFRAVGSEGYDHLGNAPAFTISLTEEKLEHFSSMSGTKTKAKPVIQVSVSWLELEFHRVRLCDGSLLDGIMNGNIAAPTEPITPIHASAPHHHDRWLLPPRAATMP